MIQHETTPYTLPDLSKPSKPKSPPTHFLPLLVLSIISLLTLTILLLPITSLSFNLFPPASKPTYPLPFHPHPPPQEPESYILTPFLEDPLNHTPHGWIEAALIPPTSGGGLFAAHLDEATAAVVRRVDPNRTHSGTRDRSYGIAMFHQLHCLGALRGWVFGDVVALWGDQHQHQHQEQRSRETGDGAGAGAGAGNEERLDKRHELTDDDRDHLDHCFNYILQSILCSASDTIERPKHIVPNGRPGWHVDGIGDVHRCRDAKQLWRVSEESLKTPVDMRGWNGEGVGVREFLGV